MNRREFMMAAATAAMGGCVSTDAQKGAAASASLPGADAVKRVPAPPRNRHPYKDVDWTTALQIRGGHSRR